MGDHRVLRGGSWNNNGRNAAASIRNRNEPQNRNENIGLRVSPSSSRRPERLDGTGLLSSFPASGCGRNPKRPAAGP